MDDADTRQDDPEAPEKLFDLEGAHFYPALLAVIVVTVVLFTVTLNLIFAGQRAGFAALETFPYTVPPTTRPLSWPSRDAMGLPPEVEANPAVATSLQEFFDAGLQSVREGNSERFAEIGGQLLAAPQSSAIESLLDKHIRSQEVSEMFLAVWLAGERLRQGGGQPAELLVKGTPSTFMNRMLDLAEPGASAVLIIDRTIALFGKDAADAAARHLGDEARLRTSCRVALLQSPVGRQAFFEGRYTADPDDAVHSVVPFLRAQDEDWIRAQMAQRQGDTLALVAALAAALHERTGAFEAELEGAFQDLLREQLAQREPGTAGAAILALRYNTLPYAPELLLDRLAGCASFEELPAINLALVKRMDGSHGARLSAMIQDGEAPLAARTYASLMLVNLARRQGDPGLWDGSENAAMQVFGLAMRSAEPTLIKATFAVLLLEDFDAGPVLLRELLRDASNTSLQMFLIKKLKDSAMFRADLEAVRDDPEQKPLVRDAIQRLFSE